MLTAPKNKDSARPLFDAKDIVPFYFDECPKIFPVGGWYSWLSRVRRILRYPKYDGKYLRTRLAEEELLGDKRLDETLTNIVIPAFDIKKLEPVIFSSYEVKGQSSLNVKLSDICLATSAAPTVLPPHQFSSVDNETEFNLIDGGVAANNPVKHLS
ncbi:unnamed protein product [Eruca vesicaria subsp. sativa]|uniref:Patatin n=1 Tax=Eruca vesicaria subsp. sativa TaxID=29727 RepID=A0ABC8L8V3_ERUVS|nr:unnamed protein product [Eruca vesicaria subsp. sativa]